jgi:DNA-binding transcriptional MerR regulator
MARPHDLIGIGDFARRVRLTAKQLRGYDELGLLAPAYVDPDTGYRYYHRGQARTAVTIALLRSLGVPLADIHDLLVAEPGETSRLLARQRRRLEDEVARGLAAIRSLDHLLAGTELLPYDVVERDEPALALNGLGGTCGPGELDDAVPALFAALGADDTEPVVGLYPLDLEAEIDFFVGVAGPAPGADETRSLEPARVAVTTHIGAYTELPLAYFPLIAHVEERGRQPAAEVREVYLDAARTEVLLPFTKGAP